MNGEFDTDRLKETIREQDVSDLGEDVTVQFVEDANRLDVRITDLGIEAELRAREADLTVNSYSDYRFTVRFE
jgi:hypothetical protein